MVKGKFVYTNYPTCFRDKTSIESTSDTLSLCSLGGSVVGVRSALSNDALSWSISAVAWFILPCVYKSNNSKEIFMYTNENNVEIL